MYSSKRARTNGIETRYDTALYGSCSTTVLVHFDRENLTLRSAQEFTMLLRIDNCDSNCYYELRELRVLVKDLI